MQKYTKIQASAQHGLYLFTWEIHSFNSSWVMSCLYCKNILWPLLIHLHPLFVFFALPPVTLEPRSKSLEEAATAKAIAAGQVAPKPGPSKSTRTLADLTRLVCFREIMGFG